MAKNYPTSPEKIITRINNHRNDQIYLTSETVAMCRKNPPEGYNFLLSGNNHVIDGKACVRLEIVDCIEDDSRLYTFPAKGKIRLY